MDTQLTIEQLGQKAKAKYPQYANLSDKEVGERIIKQYPAYASVVVQPQVEAPKEEGVRGAKGAAVGLVKGRLNTALNIFSGVQNVGQRVLAAVTPGKSLDDIRKTTGFKSLDSSTQEGQIVRDALKTRGTAEKIGNAIGSIAELAVPLSKVDKIGKAAQAATKVRLGTSVVGKTAGVAARAGVEAVGGAASVAIQEGEINKNARDAAIISAIFPAAGAAFRQGRALTRETAKEFAPRIVNSLIKPLSKDLSYGKNPGRAIAEEGIVANNFEELAQKITERRNAVGDQIGLTLSTPEAQAIKLDLTDALSPIDEAIKQAQKAPRTNAALISRLEDAKKDILGVVEEADGTVNFTKQLKDITPLEATGIKRDIGDITKFTGNASDDKLVNGALKRVYGNIKGKVDDAVPGIKDLNERWADLTSAKIATEYREKILERQNLISFNEQTIGTASGFLYALSSGGAALQSVLFGLGSAGLVKILKSPRVKTELAAYLARISPKERQELFKKVPWLKAVAIRVVTSSEE